MGNDGTLLKRNTASGEETYSKCAYYILNSRCHFRSGHHAEDYGRCVTFNYTPVLWRYNVKQCRVYPHGAPDPVVPTVDVDYGR